MTTDIIQSTIGGFEAEYEYTATFDEIIVHMIAIRLPSGWHTLPEPLPIDYDGGHQIHHKIQKILEDDADFVRRRRHAEAWEHAYDPRR